MKIKNNFKAFCLISIFLFSCLNSFANNITVSNVSLVGQNITEHYIMIKFDISWENSWRISTAQNNWDAAWVFIKYRTGSGSWKHALINDEGHINPAGCTIVTG